jgi:toxin-antitoxin system PIN domain toxin
LNLIDVNLLVYAYDEGSPFHRPAKLWLENEFNAAGPTGLTTFVIVAFLRIVTNPRIFARPMDIADACAIVERWLALPDVHILQPTARHWSILKKSAIEAHAIGAIVPDAELAASAIEHGATLCTNDRDFARFQGLRVSYPLAI